MTEFLLFLKSIPFHAPPLFVTDLISFFFLLKVFNLHVGGRKQRAVKLFTIGSFSIIQSVFVFLLSDSSLTLLARIVVFSIYSAFFVFAMSLLIHLNAKHFPLYKIMMLSILILHLNILVEMISGFFLLLIVLITNRGDILPISNAFAPLFFYLFDALLLFGTFVILLRTRFYNYLYEIFEQRSLCIKLCWVAAVIQIASYSLLHAMKNTLYWSLAISGIIVISFLLCLFLIAVYSKNLSKTLELKQSRLLLLQQQAYMKQLEAIQNELRTIQHDHKNLITGLYLHAKDGDTKEIQRYIEKFLLNMDEGIQEQMKWSNQLTSIASPELKGLLLSKMLLAQQHDVFFNLEVATTVEEIKMATNDFIRCMGILLDNAVEAAQCEDENRRVDILFYKEEDKLTLVVKNPCQEKVNLAKIRNRGVSTKGSGRGLGLSIYQEVVQKYNNILSETKQQNGEFIQELAIFDT